MKLEEFVTTYHPEWVKEFERFSKTFDVLKVGTKVKTLRGGFGGYGNDIRIVAEVGSDQYGVHGKFVILTQLINKKERYLLYEKQSRKDYWWNAVEVIED